MIINSQNTPFIYIYYSIAPFFNHLHSIKLNHSI